MESFITFTPPQLPPIMSPELLSKHITETYPELDAQDAHLGEVLSALRTFNFTCDEYQARNAHYQDWMQWYKENPSQKDKVVAFAIEHNVCFGLSRTALEMLDSAVGRLIETWGDRKGMSAIRGILTAVEQDAQNLARNLQALQSSRGPTGQPQILPQKRPASNS